MLSARALALPAAQRRTPAKVRRAACGEPARHPG
jgi:hypothetical protein